MNRHANDHKQNHRLLVDASTHSCPKMRSLEAVNGNPDKNFVSARWGPPRAPLSYVSSFSWSVPMHSIRRTPPYCQANCRRRLLNLSSTTNPRRRLHRGMRHLFSKVRVSGGLPWGTKLVRLVFHEGIGCMAFNTIILMNFDTRYVTNICVSQCRNFFRRSKIRHDHFSLLGNAGAPRPNQLTCDSLTRTIPEFYFPPIVLQCYC
jgi:hypothetical protein